MASEVLEREKCIEWLMGQGLLASPELVEKLSEPSVFERLRPILGRPNSPLVVNGDILHLLPKRGEEFDWIQLEKLRAESEITRDSSKYQGFLSNVAQEEAKRAEEFNVEIVESYNEASSDRAVQDFVSFFNARYKSLSRLISGRPGLMNNVSIARLKNKPGGETASIIGLVRDIAMTKNNNLMLTLEDPTGSVKVVVQKSNREMYAEAIGITLDEVIGVTGMGGANILFASSIVWPDIPMLESKKSPNHEFAIVLSDLHVGSKLFLETEFRRFLAWIRGELGNPTQTEIAKRTKYIFIVGDLVDGVGIYPDQYGELAVKDIYEQYKLCAELISQIPKDKAIIVCPGNHDALRLSEPQPPLNQALARPLYEIPNVINGGNQLL